MDSKTTAKNESEVDEYKQNLRTEYAAVSSYFNQTINFRFLTFGFYITMMVIFAENKSIEHPIITYSLMCVLLFSIWLIEMRNRSLGKSLQQRGKKLKKFYFLINISIRFFHV